MEALHPALPPPAAPGYMELLLRGGGTFMDALRECKDCGWELSLATLKKHASLTWAELLCLLIGALVWTGLRKATTRWIFQPFAHWCLLHPKEASKVPESAWKLLFYTISWSYSFYLLFFTEYNFFHDPSSSFHGWKSGVQVPRDIAMAYLIQGSFYAHSTYATIYMDSWRKDSIVMILHHVVTFTLITFSYAFRFWFRLFWFPQKVLYATCYSSLESDPNIPFYFFFNSLLFVLTLMNIYWFLYIVMFVVKVLTGQVKEVNDVREYDVSENQKLEVPAKNNNTRHRDALSNGQSILNGCVKKKRM
ncbi:hypothetical protein XENTR_v10001565 [Xenopus tropicalis]|nr:hypothetical protein XENTR_v10001565 [Xenopus tropicalis]